MLKSSVSRQYIRFMLVMLFVVGTATSLYGQALNADFDKQEGLADWETSGDVRLDTSNVSEGAALRIGAGGKVVRKFREENAGGRVEMRVYDALNPPKNPKQRSVGPRWGLLMDDGTVLGVGQIYAPYLAGNMTYCTTLFNGETWFNVQYLGESKRSQGWHTWVFDMDPERGLSISFDGKNVNASRKRFDWNKTGFEGFVGIVFYGDNGKGAGETVWFDDVRVTLKGPMQVAPKQESTVEETASVVPANDPATAGPVPELVAGAKGVHPRLLFGPDELESMKRLYNSPEGAVFRKALLDYLPVCKAPDDRNFLKDATDGQRQGLWRMPTVALHYALTDDQDSFEKAHGFMEMLLALPHWETGRELDSGMSAANIMIGAALCYDWLYNDLDPEFREQFRLKLLYQSRAMYYGGHLRKNPGTHYWQGDPANNHRWHRDAGLALCVLAAYDGHESQDWILAKTLEELQYIAKWLPEDGTSHESPGYMIFGLTHLTLAMQSADQCLGTDFTKGSFFKGVGDYLTQSLVPGLKQRFSYGDSATGVKQLGYDAALYHTASIHRQGDVQAVLNRVVEQHGLAWGWMGLVWFDRSVEATDLDVIAQTRLFEDIGVVFLRDSWGNDGTAAMFKCGPMGGYTLNRYRNANDMAYINVAHDDPDANSFVIFSDGQFVAETDRYSKQKRSANHNTILVNGIGQLTAGRKEGQVWSQPGGDMARMAYLTAWKDAGDVVVVEGEASGAYIAVRGKRPALERFRRTFIWVKGAYILVLDDIAAPQDVRVEWLLQSGAVEADTGTSGRYVLKKEAVDCPVMIRSNLPTVPSIVESTADHRGKALGWQQLRLEASGSSMRFVSLYLPWGGDWNLKGVDWEQDAAVVELESGEKKEQWQWGMASDNESASELRGLRGGDAFFQIDASDSIAMPFESKED